MEKEFDRIKPNALRTSFTTHFVYLSRICDIQKICRRFAKEFRKLRRINLMFHYCSKHVCERVNLMYGKKAYKDYSRTRKTLLEDISMVFDIPENMAHVVLCEWFEDHPSENFALPSLHELCQWAKVHVFSIPVQKKESQACA